MRRREDQLAAIKEIAAFIGDWFQQSRVYFQPGFQFVMAQGDRIQNGEGPLAIEFQIKINQPVFARLVGKAPHLVQLYAHALSVQLCEGRA